VKGSFQIPCLQSAEAMTLLRFIPKVSISDINQVLTKVYDVVCFLLGNSPASEFCMPTFRNTLSHLHRQVGTKNNNSV
jgi:hypothetical protein